MKTTAALMTGLLILGSAPLAAACGGAPCTTTRVEPGHWEHQTQRVRVPGRYVYETQQVQVPGRWETTYEETCVPGRWEWRTETVVVRQGRWVSNSCRRCARVNVRPFRGVKVSFGACGPNAHRRWIAPRPETVRKRVWIPAQTVRKPASRAPCTS